MTTEAAAATKQQQQLVSVPDNIQTQQTAFCKVQIYCRFLFLMV